MTTIQLTCTELADLDAEIAACEQTQSWAPHSVRSGWIGELAEIREASANMAEGDAAAAARLTAALIAADTEAQRLATIALATLDLDAFRARATFAAEQLAVDNGMTDADEAAMLDALSEATTWAEAEAWIIRYGVEISDGTNGARDGFEVSPANGIVRYASCREWSTAYDIDPVSDRPATR